MDWPGREPVRGQRLTAWAMARPTNISKTPKYQI
jgi:hypothetical protein